MPTSTLPSGIARTYSCSSVYLRSPGIFATRVPLVSDSTKPNELTRCRRVHFVADDRIPDAVDFGLELPQRSRILDDKVGARALEIGRHLRRDHLHRFGLFDTAVTDDPLEPDGSRGIDEKYRVEVFSEMALEQEGYDADDQPLAAQPGRFDVALSKAHDLGMDDLVQLVEVRLLLEHDMAKRCAIEVSVSVEYAIAPSGDDRVESRTSLRYSFAREYIGVDDRRAALGKNVSDCRLAAGDVSGESYESHRTTRVMGMTKVRSIRAIVHKECADSYINRTFTGRSGSPGRQLEPDK